MKMIQVFKVEDEGVAEISAECIDCRYLDRGVLVTTKELKYMTTYFVPYEQLSMLRFFEEK